MKAYRVWKLSVGVIVKCRLSNEPGYGVSLVTKTCKTLAYRAHSAARAFVLAALAGVAIAGAAVAQTTPSTWERIHSEKVLRVAGTNSELWAFKEIAPSDMPGAVEASGARWRGIGPNLGKILADALNVKLEIVDTTWGTAVAGLQANQFDIIFGFDPTPPRAAAVDFVPKELFWYGPGVLVRENVDVSSWKAIEDQKLEVGVPAASSIEYVFTKHAPNAKLAKFHNFSEMIAAFQTGRLGAIATTNTSATLIGVKFPNTKVVMPEGPKVLFAAGTGIRKEVDPRWRSFLTTAIMYYNQNGTIQQLLSDVFAHRGVETSKVPPILKPD